MGTPRLFDLALPAVGDPQFRTHLLAALRRFSDQINNTFGSSDGVTPNTAGLLNNIYYAARIYMDGWVYQDGRYRLTVAHNLGTNNILPCVWRESFEQAIEITDTIEIKRITSSTLQLWVSALPDERFAGRILIVARPDTVIGTYGGSGSSGSSSGSSEPAWNKPDSLRCNQPFEPPWAWNQSGGLKLGYLAVKDLSVFSGYQVLAGTDPNALAIALANASFVYGGKLVNDYPSTTLAVDDVAGFIVEPTNNNTFQAFYDYGSVTRTQLLTRQRIAVVGTEIMAVQRVALVTTTPHRYRLTGVIRGLYDTRPQLHVGNTDVFLLLADNLPFTVPNLPEWGNGVTLTCKAIPYTDTETGQAAQINTRSITLRDRAARPYAVTGLRVDGCGAVHGPTYTETVPFQVSWLGRNRLEPATSDEWLGQNGELESGQDFMARLYDPAGNLLEEVAVGVAETVTGDDGVTRWAHEFTVATGGFAYVRVSVNSRRNGLESLDSLDPQTMELTRV